MSAGVWTRIADEMPPSPRSTRDRIILIATAWGVLGVLTDITEDEHGTNWFVDGDYHDGDDPVFWLSIPPLPSLPRSR